MKEKYNPLEVQGAHNRISSFKISWKQALVELMIGGGLCYALWSYKVIPFTFHDDFDGWLDLFSLFAWGVPLLLIYLALQTLFFPSKAQQELEILKKEILNELKKKS